MNIKTTALIGNFSQFETEFEPGMEQELFAGSPLVLEAAANTSSIDRFRMMNYLLDRRCRVDGQGGEGVGVFHALFGATKRDAIAETASILERLLDAGADVNHVDDRGRDALFELIIVGATDEVLAPIYDLWFAQNLQNIERPAKDGYTPLEAARLLPYRTDMVRRMEEKVRA